MIKWQLEMTLGGLLVIGVPILIGFNWLSYLSIFAGLMIGLRAEFIRELGTFPSRAEGEKLIREILGEDDE